MELITICIIGTGAAIAYLISKICLYRRNDEVLLIGPVIMPENNDEEIPPKYEDINN